MRGGGLLGSRAWKRDDDGDGGGGEDEDEEMKRVTIYFLPNYTANNVCPPFSFYSII